MVYQHSASLCVRVQSEFGDSTEMAALVQQLIRELQMAPGLSQTG